MTEPVDEVNLPGIKKFASGKVREIFDLGDRFLIVATDRISAFDYILPTLIPEKGKTLSKLSVFWFNKTKYIMENHFITDQLDKYPGELKQYKDILVDRSMLVKKANPLDVECVVRGYIAGSGWKDYQKTGLVGGVKLDNLKQGDELPDPMFTPATKAHTGHDENISFEQMKEIVPEHDAEFIKSKSIELYKFAHDYARERNIIIADTKFEFGKLDNRIILIDEIFTPDSSRFWNPELYKPGGSQVSFDKQFVRDYLSSTDWDRNSPPPELPPDIVEKTVARYKEALNRITKSI